MLKRKIVTENSEKIDKIRTISSYASMVVSLIIYWSIEHVFKVEGEIDKIKKFISIVFTPLSVYLGIFILFFPLINTLNKKYKNKIKKFNSKLRRSKLLTTLNKVFIITYGSLIIEASFLVSVGALIILINVFSKTSNKLALPPYISYIDISYVAISLWSNISLKKGWYLTNKAYLIIPAAIPLVYFLISSIIPVQILQVVENIIYPIQVIIFSFVILALSPYYRQEINTLTDQLLTKAEKSKNK